VKDRSARLRRPRFSIIYPQSWWDFIFIRTAGALEGFSSNQAFRLLYAFPAVVFRVLVWGVSPATDPKFEHRPSWKRIIVVAVAAAIAGFIFSFGLNYLFARAAGTLSGPEKWRLYFLDDTANLRIYTSIAPVYIACSSVIIYVYLSSSLFLKKFDEDWSVRDSALMATRLVLFALLLLGVDALLQYRYFTEIITSYGRLPHMLKEGYKHCSALTYWFAEKTASGPLALNVAGMMYFIGNFVRLAIVITAAYCFVGAAASLVKFGLQVSAGTVRNADIGEIRERIYSYSIIELWMKGLYLILTIHGKVWGESCLTGDVNIQLAGAVVFAVGWVMLTVPRNFVEYQLWRTSRDRASGPNDGLPDLRNQETLWVYTFGSSLFFLAAGYLTLSSIDGPVGPDALRKLLDLLGFGWILRFLGAGA
jgi:hypothetical protein